MNLSTFNVDAQGMASNGAAYVKLPDNARAVLAESGESTVVVGFRPEGLELVSDAQQLPADSHGVVAFTVAFTEELGSDTYLYGHLSGSDGNLSAAAPVAAQNATDIVMRVNANTHVQTGETVHAAIAGGGLHVFSSGDGERLN